MAEETSQAVTNRLHSMSKTRSGLLRYALLNFAACLLLLAVVPHVARESLDAANALRPQSAPKLQNLVELREVSASKRPAPTPEMLARLPAKAVPSVPLSAATKLAVLELVSETNAEAAPLANALDAAESLPTKPLRLLHRTRYRALYAELAKRDAQRRAFAETKGAVASRQASRSERAERRRELLALAASQDESAGAIVHRNLTNAMASLTP